MGILASYVDQSLISRSPTTAGSNWARNLWIKVYFRIHGLSCGYFTLNDGLNAQAIK